MKNVADIYAITPMQQLMYLHAQRAKHDTLLSQFCYRINGNMDLSALQHAWQSLVNRHTSLRTVFVAGKDSTPLQVVRQTVELPFTVLDLRGTKDQNLAIASYAEQDQLRGFDLRKAPLMRVSVLKLTDTRHLLVWTSHHLILDRWCIDTIWHELAALYQSPQPRLALTGQGFRAYVQWLAEQDRQAAEEFWINHQQAATSGTRLTRADRMSAGESATVQIDETMLPALRRLCQNNRCTMSTLVQAAWALQIAVETDSTTVAYGCTAAGRPGEIANIENIIGSFVINVPVVLTLDGELTMTDLLAQLQSLAQRRSKHEWLGTIDIERLSPVLEGATFDSLFIGLGAVSEPYLSDDLQIVPSRGKTPGSAYALTMTFAHDKCASEITATLSAGRSLSSARTLTDFLNSFTDLLRHIASNKSAPLSVFTGLGSDHNVDTEDLVARDPDTSQRASNALPATNTQINGAVSSANRRWPTTARSNQAASVVNNGGRELLSRADIVALLHDLWCDALVDVVPADLTDDSDFFDLGGDSLSAVKLHNNLEASTRTNIPLTALFAQSSFGTMADSLTSSNWPLQGGCAIALRPTGASTPLFTVASPEVNTLGYAMLARHLDHNVPVFILQSPPQAHQLDRLDPGLLPQLAADYIAAMKDVQPQGPYRLIGMCTGAHIAHQMAIELHQQGESVSHLGIINTWAMFTVSRFYHLSHWVNQWRWRRDRLIDLFSRDQTTRSAAFQAALRSVGLGRKDSAEAASARPSATVVTTSAGTRSVGPDGQAAQDLSIDWIQDMGWAHRRDPGYPSFPGRMTIYRIGPQPYWRTRDVDLGWGALSTQPPLIKHLTEPSHHHILREPSLHEVARTISEQLNQVAGDSAPIRKDAA